jgi:hypothetical protein
MEAIPMPQLGERPAYPHGTTFRLSLWDSSSSACRPTPAASAPVPSVGHGVTARAYSLEYHRYFLGSYNSTTPF